MRPEDYPVWKELLTLAVCFAIAAIPAYWNYRQRRALIEGVTASLRRMNEMVRHAREK